jgi:hypothetical protein
VTSSGTLNRGEDATWWTPNAPLAPGRYRVIGSVADLAGGRASFGSLDSWTFEIVAV